MSNRTNLFNILTIMINFRKRENRQPQENWTRARRKLQACWDSTVIISSRWVYACFKELFTSCLLDTAYQVRFRDIYAFITKPSTSESIFYSVAILIIEKNVSNCKQLLNSKKCYKCKAFCRVCNCSKWRLMILKCYFKWVIDPMREMMHYMDDEEERRVAGM